LNVFIDETSIGREGVDEKMKIGEVSRRQEYKEEAAQ